MRVKALARTLMIGAAVATLAMSPLAAQDRMVGAWNLKQWGNICSLETTAGASDRDRGVVYGLVQQPKTLLSLQISFPGDPKEIRPGSYQLTVDGAPFAHALLTPPGFGSAFTPPLPEGKEMKAWVEVTAEKLPLLRAARALAVVRTEGKKPGPVASFAPPPLGEGLDALAACVNEPPPAYLPPPPRPEPTVPTAPFSKPLSIGIWRIDPAEGCRIATRMKAFPFDRSKQVLGSLGFPDVNVTVRKFGERYQISVGDVPLPKDKVKGDAWSFKLGTVTVNAPLVATGYIEVGPVGLFDDLPALLGGKRELVVRYRDGGRDVDHVSIDLNHLDLAIRAQALCRAR
jgi:hypothetical protein